MKVKDYRGASLRECLQQVKNEMGAEAIILESKTVRTGGILGVGGHEEFHVRASIGEESPSLDSSNRHTSAHVNGGLPNKGAPAVMRAYKPATASGPATHNGVAVIDPYSKMQSELSDLKIGLDEIREAVVHMRSLSDSPKSSGFSSLTNSRSEPRDKFPELWKELLRNDVGTELATDLLSRLPDLSDWNATARLPIAQIALIKQMTMRINVSNGIQLVEGAGRVVALVGPTGVGKTTTIAKLAAHYALVEKKRVGLITLDTYRIAAVDQLRTYAQIINLPIRVAHSKEEILPALKAFMGYDLVLVDTAGRSQKNLAQIAELKAVVDTAKCETHLVLSASTKQSDLSDQIDRFSTIGIDRLLFTKLDETTTYGTIFSIAAHSTKLVSYLTTGQKVPEDIEEAESNRLAQLVIKSHAPEMQMAA